ncbi:ganglioside gm2 activator [Plakobranchus ocellatus]|uniref:Ganglioside gm2 activator n=1 Tax=Plakobranchus ocellatus TaxID=259542 RepID=A0AAV3Y6W1_9GAST|nr:ganglioside gm2 activator [Plakobranchus ocellatus]
MFGIICFITFFGLILVVFSDPLIITDCGNEDDLIKIKNIRMMPDELPIPGNITLSAEIEVNKDLAGAQLDLEVSIQKHFIFWLPIPCSSLGSCAYDVCQVLDNKFCVTGCPPLLANNGIPCLCDTIKAGNYSISNQRINIPAIPGYFSWLATGYYRADLKLRDRTANKYVGCLHIEVTIV